MVVKRFHTSILKKPASSNCSVNPTMSRWYTLKTNNPEGRSTRHSSRRVGISLLKCITKTAKTISNSAVSKGNLPLNSVNLAFIPCSWQQEMAFSLISTPIKSRFGIRFNNIWDDKPEPQPKSNAFNNETWWEFCSTTQSVMVSTITLLS